MNDTPSTSTAAPAGPVTTSATGAGQLLRQYRETAGLHIVALSSALKVGRAKLEALEADRLDDLPDIVFARALAMSCCRYLGKDPEPVLVLMPGHAAQPTPSLRQHLPTQNDNAPRPKFNPSRGPFGSPAVPSWVIWALVLVVIVVGGWFAASPQRPVVKPPASALDFPPQGVPGAEPVTGTSDPVAAGAPGAPAVASPAGTLIPGTAQPGAVTIVPAPLTPATTSPLRVEPVSPSRH